MLCHIVANAHTAAATSWHAIGGVQLVSHSTYSPDLSLCNWFLFLHVKNQLWETRFESAKVAVQEFMKTSNTIDETCRLWCGTKGWLADKRCGSSGELHKKIDMKGWLASPFNSEYLKTFRVTLLMNQTKIKSLPFSSFFHMKVTHCFLKKRRRIKQNKPRRSGLWMWGRVGVGGGETEIVNEC